MPRPVSVTTLSNDSLRGLVTKALNEHEVVRTKKELKVRTRARLRAREALHELYRRAELAAFVVNSY